MLFLIEYDRAKGELVNMWAFSDAQLTLAENTRIEREVAYNRQGVQREIVLLEASNEEDLRRTHGRYFKDLATLACAEES
jgi:hypothetical protein